MLLHKPAIVFWGCGMKLRKNRAIYQIPVTREMKLPHIEGFFNYYEDEPICYNLGVYCEYIERLYGLTAKINRDVAISAYYDVLDQMEYCMKKHQPK